MPFNTLYFLYFFACFFPVYWLAKKYSNLQNGLLVLANMVFYGWTEPKLCGLIVAVALLIWLGAILMERLPGLAMTIYAWVIVLLFYQLFLCKYYKWFFGEDQGHPFWISLTTTVGISYYTLAAYSYITDVYRKKMLARRNFVALLAYLSFFPQLLAGPIPIAHQDFAQYLAQRHLTWTDIEQAIQRILWGLFKKAVVASQLAIPVDYIFYNHASLPYTYLWAGVLMYSFQVYMDFSGYSDMAWGLARLLGIKVNYNFNAPFIARTIDEFWRRWHLSLSAWLKEYIYIPLGGRGKNRWQYSFNIMAVFVVSGLWHGANSNFLLWGSANGLLFVLSIIWGLTRKSKDLSYNLKDYTGVITVFVAISLTRVFFRSPDLMTALHYYQAMVAVKGFVLPDVGLLGIGLSWFVVLVEFIQRRQLHAIDILNRPLYVRIPTYLVLCVGVYYFWPVINSTEYIYFKF